jgi:hypothetical protein
MNVYKAARVLTRPRRHTIPILVRTPEEQEVRPVEEGWCRRPTPEEMTFLVLNCDRLMVA